MSKLPDCSVDSVVTDPPYHLTSGKKGGSGEASVNLNTPHGRARITTGFMGKKWDGGDVAHDPAVWRECLRLLKPGGHLLAFGGSRTYHRLACAIEDAGFEIRDQIQWIYGSGFPKSLDVSKAIDAAAGAEREALPRIRVDGKATGNGGATFMSGSTVNMDYPNAVTDAAKQWNGWGTALKPAHEPIVLARKPLISTVAQNVLQHGTGGLNIDGCRIGIEQRTYKGMSANQPAVGTFRDDNWQPKDIEVTVNGRWPANVIHDGSEEVLARFPESNGGAWPANGARFGYSGGERQQNGERTEMDTGNAARFFYCAKASKEDREEGLEHSGRQYVRRDDGQPYGTNTNTHRPDGSKRKPVPPKGNYHPTVKPTDLMRYLCRLVTPPGGIVLDPFCGSGSTGKAAILEQLNFIGIELSAEYCELSQKRIAAVTAQGSLFGIQPQMSLETLNVESQDVVSVLT